MSKKRGRPHKERKRKAGRPRRQPKSGEQLREEARARLQAAAARRKAEEPTEIQAMPSIEEVAEEVSAITLKHKYTKEEMVELREKVSLLYQDYLDRQAADEWEANKQANEKAREAAIENSIKSGATNCMTEEEWNAAHGLRFDGSKKRGPKPKRKKFFYEIEPGERGLAEHPSEAVDLDTMERAIEAQLMEEYIKERAEERKFYKGKRIRDHQPVTRTRQPQQNFWH